MGNSENWNEKCDHVRVFSPTRKNRKQVRIVWETLSSLSPPTTGLNVISSQGKTNLQQVLSDTFNRKIRDRDAHGVNDYTIERTVEDLDDSEVLTFGNLQIPNKQLKEQCKSFQLFFIPEFCSTSEANEHFRGKLKRGRDWNQIFNKHFYVTSSNISILYDEKGKPFEKCTKPQEVCFFNAVGIDVSAHRLTGVHFADLLRYLSRIDKKDISQGCKNDGGAKDAKSCEIWKDAMSSWNFFPSHPSDKYDLNTDLLREDYKIIYSLILKAVELRGVKVAILSALGCGVFSKKFWYEYVECVVEALGSILSEKKYQFDMVILCDVSENNFNLYKKYFAKFEGMKNTLIISRLDMLAVATHLTRTFKGSKKISILSAGDFWEFGQFWETMGSLEEYLTKMTTAYFSQHFKMNPSYVLDEKEYVPVNVEDLGISISKDHVEELQKFVKKIQTEFQ